MTMEKMTYDTPLVVKPPVTGIAFEALELRRDLARIVLVDSNGEPVSHYYRDDEAAGFFKEFNSADFSKVSMERWLLEKLAADEKIPAGKVAAVADAVAAEVVVP